MSDTWVPEENVTGSAAAAAAPDVWSEDKPQSWGDWLRGDRSFANDLAGPTRDIARVAASNIPLWDRARALPDVVMGKPYSQAVDEQAAETQAARNRLGPFVASSSDIAGGAALGYGLLKSGLTTVGRGIVDATQPLWKRLLVSGVEAGTHGAIQGASHTYSESLPDYVKNAQIGGGTGFVLGTALPAAGWGAQKLYNTVSDKLSGVPTPVLNAGRVDAQGLRDLPRLGPDAMLPDAGPSMLAVAQGASQGVGDSRSGIVRALTDRNNATVPRLQADREAILGPAPRVSQIEEGIDQTRQAINANEYAPRLRGQSIDPQGADAAIAALHTLGQTSRVDMGPVINAVTLPGTKNLPDLSPQTWLQARHNIDSMITVANRSGNRYEVGVLTQARDHIDNQLAASVPGIKTADALHAANSAEGEALTTGQTLLDKGKNAVHPQDLADVMTAAPPMVNIRLRQGAHADLERRLGTDSNDLAQLEKTMGTPEDWNFQKMRSLFGAREAQEIADSIFRNRTFRDTYQAVVGGPNTAQKIAAGEDLNVKPVTNWTSGGLWSDVKKLGVGALNAVREAGAEQRRNQIASVMALRDPAEVAAMRARILQQNDKTARVGPLVNQATRAAIQGGTAAALPELYADEESKKPSRIYVGPNNSGWR